MTYHNLSNEDFARLDNTFTYHAPFGDQAERYADIRRAGGILAGTLMNLCPRSRELSLALTAVEEAVMRANQAIALNEKEPVQGSDLAYVSD